MSEDKLTKIEDEVTNNVENVEENEKVCGKVDFEELKKKAVEKLEKEKAGSNNKNFAEPILGYLIQRCKEDSGLADDVLQEHKTWNKCFKYIFDKARKQAVGNCAAIRDDVVYEWAEDYYHLDDKALEEKKAKEAAERKKKVVEQKKKDDVKEDKKEVEQKDAEKKSESATNEVDQKEEKSQSKKKSGELDGQMDLFSMMGL